MRNYRNASLLFIAVSSILFLTSVSKTNAQIIGDTNDIVWKIGPDGGNSIEFSPDSRYIMVWSEYNRLTRVFLTENGELIKSLAGQDHPAWSKDGNFIATNSRDSIFIWHFPSLDTFRVIKTNQHPIYN